MWWIINQHYPLKKTGSFKVKHSNPLWKWPNHEKKNDTWLWMSIFFLIMATSLKKFKSNFLSKWKCESYSQIVKRVCTPCLLVTGDHWTDPVLLYTGVSRKVFRKKCKSAGNRLPIGIMGSFQGRGPQLQDFREIWENFTVRTRRHKFWWIYWSNCLTY